MASWIGLEILIPKHPWKSKIGLLQPILAAKRNMTFFWVTLNKSLHHGILRSVLFSASCVYVGLHKRLSFRRD